MCNCSNYPTIHSNVAFRQNICSFTAIALLPPTREEVLGSQVADAQAEDGQFVQSCGNFFWERQQAGQTLQLAVQPVSVPLGRVGLGAFGRRLLHPGEHGTERANQSGRSKNSTHNPLFRVELIQVVLETGVLRI